jgi:pSer/pThr/pTyr-binding forkhead associated (FHA) protein
MIGPVVLVLRLLAAAALYAFLGVALWMMWQELQRSATLAREYKVPSIQLEIKADDQQHLLRLFTQPEVIVGRDPISDVPLNDKAVSARHARLSFHDAQWWVDDLGSTNGTRLNREQVQGATVLTSGDEVGCGSVSLIVTLPDEDATSLTWRGGQNE